MQDVDFHPTRQLLAAGLIDGRLLVHSFSSDAAQRVHRIKAHSSSCRAARFSLAGDLLLSASTDQSMLAVDVETGKPTARKKEAHDTAINRLAAVSETLTASGAAAGWPPAARPRLAVPCILPAAATPIAARELPARLP